MRSYLKYIIKIISSGILIFLIFSCSKNSITIYPNILETAIDYFYIENKNDTVLMLLDSDEFNKYPNNINSVKRIFQAAALCEIGQVDSAKIILKKIDTTHLKDRDLYYFYSVSSLIEFRLNNYNDFIRITAPLLNIKDVDIRSIALNERLMARGMSYYGNYEYAIRLLLNSNKLFEKAGLTKSVAINQKFLANIYATIENWDKSIENINLSIKTLEKVNDIEELYYIYAVASNIYFSMNNFYIARSYIEKALAIGDLKQDTQKFSSTSVRLGKIEIEDGNYKKAIELFNNVIEIEDSYFGSKRRNIETYIGLADAYNKIKEYDKAIEFGKLALESINNNSLFNYKYEAYRELAIANININPSLSQLYMDSAHYNMKEYLKTHSADLTELINSKFALVEGASKIERLQDANKRNRYISIFSATILVLVILFLIVIARLKIRIKQTMTELVNQNLLRLKHHKKSSERLLNQTNLSEKPTSQNITKEQKNLILYTGFNRWLENSKAYLDPNLELNIAARELGTNRSYLSQSINSQGVSFTNIINSYRIREALAILEDPYNEKHNLPLKDLATEVGFNSKSVFFNTFRKETGMTPSQFKEHVRLLKITEF